MHGAHVRGTPYKSKQAGNLVCIVQIDNFPFVGININMNL